jgi:histidinol-phosphatase (PHP family)
MPLPPDYHMHTPLCHHAVGEPVEYARQAVAAGLTEIAFTDHAPMRQDGFDNWRMRADQLADYVTSVERARAAFPGLRIRLGLEVDYLPGQEEWIRELASRHEWDFFIGSVHYVSDSWDFDNPQKLSLWRERDPMEVWTIYFQRLTLAAASGLFQIIGHADLAKKFRIYPEADCSPLFEAFLDAARRTGTAVELNTAGLRKECREIYPSPRILAMALARGVPITFGSDAHAPGEVGADFAAAVALARATGYRDSLRFDRWQPHRAPLEP